MNWGGAFVVFGYVALVVSMGWQGLLAGAVHLGILLLITRLK